MRHTHHSNWLARNYSESTVLHVSTFLQVGKHSTLVLLWLEKLESCAQLAYPSQIVTFVLNFLLWPLKQEEIGIQIGDGQLKCIRYPIITYRTQGLKATRVERLLALLSIFPPVFNKINQCETNTYFKTRKSGSRNEEK